MRYTHRTRPNSPRTRIAARAVVVFASVLLASADALVRTSTAQAGRAASEVEAGKRIYREGLLPSGKPVRATVQGDVGIAGTQLNCASCHRRSGFGSSDGAAFVPPVTGRALFGENELRRADLFRKLFQQVQPAPVRARLRDLRARPAYTVETLAVALREGRDPTGRTLDALMPRYRLGDDDVRRLAAYLKSLASAPPPGVTESEVHFATVVAGSIDPDKRKAMMDVMEAFFRLKNADTERWRRRPGVSPLYKADFYGAYRRWTLHVWELKGPAETWLAQLERHYRAQPVFALVSGISAGAWWPVHDFCERAEMPCLFPNTDLPVVSREGAYSIYFTKGLAGEAEALGSYLRAQPSSAAAARIVQVYRDTELGRAPARALRRALGKDAAARLRDRVLKGDERPTPAFWKSLLKDSRPAALVLWLGDADLASLRSAQDSMIAVRRIYLSYSLLRDGPPSSGVLRDKVFLTYPFTLPQSETPHLYRVRAWLRSRKIERTFERIQVNTYFALSVAEHALEQVVENFSRDYFIECVEHETEGAPNPGIFPRLSLGPGQRFASKGSYIVKPSGGAAKLEAVSAWIVP